GPALTHRRDVGARLLGSTAHRAEHLGGAVARGDSDFNRVGHYSALSQDRVHLEHETDAGGLMTIIVNGGELGAEWLIALGVAGGVLVLVLALFVGVVWQAASQASDWFERENTRHRERTDTLIDSDDAVSIEID